MPFSQFTSHHVLCIFILFVGGFAISKKVPYPECQNVPKGEKVVMYLTENIPVSDNLPSGMPYRAVLLAVSSVFMNNNLH